MVLVEIHQEHVALGIVGEFEPFPNDPTLVIRIEAVVVIAMEVWKRGFAILWFEFDDAHAPEVGADAVDIASQSGCFVRVRRPQRAFVGLSFVPEAAAIEFAIGGGERREVRVAATLPIHVLEPEVFVFRHIKVGGGERNEAGVSELRHPVVRSIDGNLDTPMLLRWPEAHGAGNVEVVVGNSRITMRCWGILIAWPTSMRFGSVIPLISII